MQRCRRTDARPPADSPHQHGGSTDEPATQSTDRRRFVWRFRKTLAGTSIALGLIAAASAVPSASAQTNPTSGVPTPPPRASRPTGPFATASVTVPRGSVSNFGGGVIYYPTDTSQGTFGAIAISPG